MTVTAGILLAAGDAVDGSLIEWQIEQLVAAAIDVIEVVLGYDAERLVARVAGDNVEPVIDARWPDGEASWLRVGASAVPRDTRTAIICRIEDPLTAETYRQLLAEHARTGVAITRAARDGVAGWPIVVDAPVLAALRNASAERGGVEAILAAPTAATRAVDVAAFDRP